MLEIAESPLRRAGLIMEGKYCKPFEEGCVTSLVGEKLDESRYVKPLQLYLRE
jgi:hypothetical protein